jgi:hypothetical protein
MDLAGAEKIRPPTHLIHLMSTTQIPQLPPIMGCVSILSVLPRSRGAFQGKMVPTQRPISPPAPGADKTSRPAWPDCRRRPLGTLCPILRTFSQKPRAAILIDRRKRGSRGIPRVSRPPWRRERGTSLAPPGSLIGFPHSVRIRERAEVALRPRMARRRRAAGRSPVAREKASKIPTVGAAEE